MNNDKKQKIIKTFLSFMISFLMIFIVAMFARVASNTVLPQNSKVSVLINDYLDMMIIHSPQPWDKVNQSDDCKEDIESLLEVCEIKPMVNQILFHISNTPLDLIN